MSYQNILVALDRSEQSVVVLSQALTIAKQDGAKVKLFHCLPVEQIITPYTNLYGEELMGISESFREALELEKAQVEKWLTQLCQQAAERGITAEWEWNMGDAGSLISQTARKWQADLVVIGRRGLKGIAEVFLGSVSSYVVHHVPCSVLVVQGKTIPNQEGDLPTNQSGASSFNG